MSVSITPVVSTDTTYTREQIEQTTPDAFTWGIQQYTRYHNRLDERETLLGEKHPVEDRMVLEQYLAQDTDVLSDDLLSIFISHAQQAIADAEPAVHSPPYRCADPACVVTKYANGQIMCEKNGKPIRCYLRARQIHDLYETVRRLRGTA